ncbi:MAG: mannose-6-phosphate isomerase, class I [Desulfobacteraceae bacterium 4572_187]|nr:MAG: mannose-6-phosphate isomerase, class I [Desulfobacteraceae bacterium 4572_187]
MASQKVPSTALQRFFRHSAYYMYCLIHEKPLCLFIPLIFSGGIWSACGGLLSTPRAFPAGTIGVTFYKTINAWLQNENGREMKTIGLLENTIQEYAWGSYTAIPELLDESSPADVPQAELWMGAHPKAPSMVIYDGKRVSLEKIIENYPKDTLGETVADKFDNKLPYLLKVLAAVSPLSIQAHPNLAQAKEGFNRENEQKISMDAPNRNYKDANHKPECICALTPFWALNGFRKIRYILSFMEKLCPNSLGKELNELEKKHNSDGLKQFFKILMTLDQKEKKQVLSETINNAHKFTKLDPVFKWIINKHVDVPELLKVVNFEERDIKILECEKNKTAECIYESMAEEFILSVISVDSKKNYTSQAVRSAEILLCTDGQATITDFSNNKNISLKKGKSVIVPASVRMYNIKGRAKIYKASVNIYSS